ncbi:unnamed protein product [Urochloa decumbens]|uniref:RING-type domain-containing protein n=1 Tax=Urochloa decumbens TaxID=240449 RepID=A0ABC8VDI7_9POAL
MAVHAQYAAHAFPHHDPRAIARSPALDPTTAFLAGHQLGAAVFSDLTCNNDNAPRKRARVADDVAGAGLVMDMQGQRSLLPPVPVPAPHAFAAAGDVQSSRVLWSGAASTSGRAAQASQQGILSHLYRHGVEIDALLRAETERLRAGLQDARRRHARAVFSAAERAASRRLRAAEAGLGSALARSAELDERLRQAAAEAQAWRGVAEGHEAVAAGLRAALDDLLAQSPCGGAGGGGGDADAEDAQSCCDERDEHGAGRSRACRSCGGAEACVLLLPCRHLCLCGVCDAAVDACPVCAAAKNASLHVLLS